MQRYEPENYRRIGKYIGIGETENSKKSKSLTLEMGYKLELAKYDKPISYKLQELEGGSYKLISNNNYPEMDPKKRVSDKDPKGNHIFVIIDEGNFEDIAQIKENKPALRIIPGGGHYFLSGKASFVYAAGEIIFNSKGNIERIHDESGTYYFTKLNDQLQNEYRTSLENVFKAVGLPFAAFSPYEPDSEIKPIDEPNSEIKPIQVITNTEKISEEDVVKNEAWIKETKDAQIRKFNYPYDLLVIPVPQSLPKVPKNNSPKINDNVDEVEKVEKKQDESTAKNDNIVNIDKIVNINEQPNKRRKTNDTVTVEPNTDTVEPTTDESPILANAPVPEEGIHLNLHSFARHLNFTRKVLVDPTPKKVENVVQFPNSNNKNLK